MKLLIKDGRLLDPASKLDGQLDILLENGRVKEMAGAHQEGAGPRDLRRHRSGGLPRVHRHARAPARTGPGEQGIDRERLAGGGGRRLHLHRLHGQHRAGQRQPLGDRIHSSRGRARSAWSTSIPVAALSRGPAGRKPGGDGRPGRRRRSGFFRRRPLRDESRPDPQGAGIRAHARRADHRASRGPLHLGRRPGQRGLLSPTSTACAASSTPPRR